LLKIYFIRHGETKWNIERRMQGWKDSPLTERGISQAQALGEYLYDIEFDGAFCSPSERTRETAELILKNRDVPLTFVDEFREINLGQWEGQTVPELEKLYGIAFKAFWESPNTYMNEGGESFSELLQRVLKGLNKIIFMYEKERKEDKEVNILVVTHTASIKTLFTYLNNLPMDDVWKPPFIHQTSISLIEVSEKEIKVVTQGITPHLLEED